MVTYIFNGSIDCSVEYIFVFLLFIISFHKKTKVTYSSNGSIECSVEYILVFFLFIISFHKILT